MKFEYVSLDKLLPTQIGVSLREVSENQSLTSLANGFSSTEFQPIPVLESEGRYLMGDGHHRAALAYLFNKSSGKNLYVPVTIVENNSEIERFFGGSNKGHTLDSFFAHFKPSNICNRFQIPDTIPSIPIHDLDYVLCSELQHSNGNVYSPEKRELLFKLPSDKEIEQAYDDAFYNFLARLAA